jgi:ubiquinone/menaquinone biosynthesis C-methylase UbiE
MLQLAQRRAQELGRPVDLRLGDAQALDLPDAAYDTVVCTLSLCAIPDERRAIAEMRRCCARVASCCYWTTSRPGHD